MITLEIDFSNLVKDHFNLFIGAVIVLALAITLVSSIIINKLLTKNKVKTIVPVHTGNSGKIKHTTHDPYYKNKGKKRKLLTNIKTVAA
ncbi:MAG: hypothetical protein NTW62_03800 [Candidatus Nomurabacteria bacterium]|nr:hypothetical protein [Candidatus Nomurabacteria bacterium]